MKKISALFLFCIIFFLLKNKAVAQIPYRVMSTDKCIKYLESNGLSTDNFSPKLAIPSGYGLVYELPNKELVVIPTDFRREYMGLIFANKEAFNEMIANDFFAVDHKYLTFWEKERNDLNRLPESTADYYKFLHKTLNLEIKSFDYDYFKTTYQSIMNYFSKHREAYTKDKIALAYSLEVMKYLIETKNGKWEFGKRYELYNSYIYPSITINDEYVNVIAVFYSSLSSKQGNFQMFSDFVGLTPN